MASLKDKYFGPNDITVISYPPVPEEPVADAAKAFFRENITRGSRVPIPEIRGGNIALIETNNNKVQRPLDSLERMHACREKQVAFNQRILKNEEMVSGINSEIADFLCSFDARPETRVYACVNVADQSRGWQPVCGQIWLQEDRQQAAISVPYSYPGADLDSSREHTAI
jgi:hypothetical protein